MPLHLCRNSKRRRFLKIFYSHVLDDCHNILVLLGDVHRHLPGRVVINVQSLRCDWHPCKCGVPGCTPPPDHPNESHKLAIAEATCRSLIREEVRQGCAGRTHVLPKQPEASWPLCLRSEAELREGTKDA